MDPLPATLREAVCSLSLVQLGQGVHRHGTPAGGFVVPIALCAWDEAPENPLPTHPQVEFVRAHSPRIITEELQDPGIADVYADLMSHGGRNTYSTRLPPALADAGFGQVQTGMGRGFGATVLAVRHDGELLDAGWESPLPAGSVLYYVSERRLSPEEIARSCAS